MAREQVWDTSWHKYKVRQCYSLHQCAICWANISAGQMYHDGGHKRRAHTQCVEELDEMKAKRVG